MKPRDFLFLGLLCGAIFGFMAGQYLGAPKKPTGPQIWQTKTEAEERADAEAMAKLIDPLLQVFHSAIIHGGGQCDCDWSQLVPPCENSQGDGNNSIERDRDRND